MNPLQEHANLFANGKFKYNYIGLKQPNVLDVSTLHRIYEANVLKDCTLIARPIEDMTDEEHDMWMRKRYSGSEGLFESPCSFNYLLSIGCLPKIWDYCFDDGTVIDSRAI